MRWILSCSAGLAFIGAASVWTLAQQPPAGQAKAGKAPTSPPPITWPSPPLADGPIVVDTAIQHQVRPVPRAPHERCEWSLTALPQRAKESSFWKFI